jgi:hypothetical protein
MNKDVIILLDEILYHVDTIDEEGFSNEKIKNVIQEIVKQIKEK